MLGGRSAPPPQPRVLKGPESARLNRVNIIKEIGVLQDTAPAPQPPTNQTGHQMSRQPMTQNEEKCQFRAKFGRFGAKNPNFYWRKQKFWYPHNPRSKLARSQFSPKRRLVPHA